MNFGLLGDQKRYLQFGNIGEKVPEKEETKAKKPKKNQNPADISFEYLPQDYAHELVRFNNEFRSLEYVTNGIYIAKKFYLLQVDLDDQTFDNCLFIVEYANSQYVDV